MLMNKIQSDHLPKLVHLGWVRNIVQDDTHRTCLLHSSHDTGFGLSAASYYCIHVGQGKITPQVR